MMPKLDLAKTKPKPDPLFEGFPEKFKDPAIFEETEKKIQDTLKTSHTHRTAKSYAKCEECQKKREDRQKMMKEMGFKSVIQYLQWKKIMGIMIAKKDFQLR